MAYTYYVDEKYKFSHSIPCGWTLESGRFCFEENKSKNSNLEYTTLLQFVYGTIVRKKNQEIAEPDKEIYKKYTIVEPNDIILNGLNLNYDFVSQRIGIVKEIGVITSAYLALRCRNVLVPQYANYLLKAYDEQKFFHGFGRGIRLTLGYSEFSKIQFPIPPREEQDQIVRYLDWQVSKINKLIHGYQRKIDLIEEKKRVFVFTTVTQGLRKSPNTISSNIYWLKSIPAHWTTKNIVQLFDEVKRKNKGMQEKNLLSLSYGSVIRRDINATEGLLPESFEGYNIVEKDDIVLRLTDLQNDHKSLRTGIAKERGIITSAYLTIRNKSGNNSEYLQLFLHVFDLAKGFYNIGASGVRQSLNWDAIKTLSMLIPPIEEQVEIVEAVHNEYKKTTAAIEAIKRQIALLKEYRTRLISDVVTGQLDVRGIEIPEFEYVEETTDVSDDDEPNEGSTENEEM
jgi:type I restriction enzyme S subunit